MATELETELLTVTLTVILTSFQTFSNIIELVSIREPLGCDIRTPPFETTPL